MTFALATAVAAVLNTLALLHLYWAMGGRWGHDAALPRRSTGERLFEPSKRSTVLVALILVGAALVVQLAVRDGMFHGVAGGLVAMLAFVFLARAIGDFKWLGLFKRENASKFSRLDTRFYVPLSLLLALACACISFEALS
ncbi:MAG: hypothetical protein JWM77_1332 [Rhodospirillales bacterium]|nr:hypothetical protein [Rhodospirillales bacterium]